MKVFANNLGEVFQTELDGLDAAFALLKILNAKMKDGDKGQRRLVTSVPGAKITVNGRNFNQ